MNGSSAPTFEETAESPAQLEEVSSTGSVTMSEKEAHPNPSASTVAETRELAGILEALLFTVTEPLSMNRLIALLAPASKHEIERALHGLQESYGEEGRGLHLVEIAGGYRIVTKPDYAPWIKRLDKIKPPAKLSRSALESLAIIAYKQPIVRAEIEQIRGVETSGVLRTLLERKLVRIVGRKEEPGRPIMYGTTKFFLEHFGLRDLSQLPPLQEFKELGESEQAMLPIEGEEEPTSFGASEATVTASHVEDNASEEAEGVTEPEEESCLVESGQRN